MNELNNKIISLQEQLLTAVNTSTLPLSIKKLVVENVYLSVQSAIYKEEIKNRNEVQ